MKTIPSVAVFGPTFCINCDEEICACSQPNYVPRYTTIEGETYLIKDEEDE